MLRFLAPVVFCMLAGEFVIAMARRNVEIAPQEENGGYFVDTRERREITESQRLMARAPSNTCAPVG